MKKHDGKEYDPIEQKDGETWKDFLERFRDHLDEDKFSYSEVMSIASDHYNGEENSTEDSDSGNDSEESGEDPEEEVEEQGQEKTAEESSQESDQEESDEQEEEAEEEDSQEKEDYEGPSKHGNEEPVNMKDRIGSSDSGSSGSSPTTSSENSPDTPVGIEQAVNNIYARAFIMDLDPESEEAKNFQKNLKAVADDVDLGANAERVIKKYLDNYDELTPEQALMVSCGLAIVTGFTIRPEAWDNLKGWWEERTEDNTGENEE